MATEQTAHEPEPGSRLGKGVLPYQGPSHRTRAGRTRLVLGALAVLIVVYAALVWRLLGK